MIFIRYPFHSNKTVLDSGGPVKTDRIKDEIAFVLGINGFSLMQNDKILHDEDIVPDNSIVYVTFSLPGGKGGFGSMLRAIGAQIEKTTNREACRDLSGRRLRDINEEQRLKKWIAKESEREAEKIKRRQARIERLKTKAPHKFFDYEYEKEISNLPDRINDALSEGLQKAKPKKRSHEHAESSIKPKKSWMAEDLSGSSSDSDCGEMNTLDEDNPKKRKTASTSSGCHTVSSENYSAKDFTSEESMSSEPENAFRAVDNSDSNEAHEKAEQNMDLNENSMQESSEEVEKSNEKAMEVDSDVAKQSDLVVETKRQSSDISGTETNDPNKESGITTIEKELETKDDSPIDLTNFQSVSELEALGLDKLKSALMARGLKCGGTLSDRAQRLWKIRHLQPHEYPANLLAKSKK